MQKDRAESNLRGHDCLPDDLFINMQTKDLPLPQKDTVAVLKQGFSTAAVNKTVLWDYYNLRPS